MIKSSSQGQGQMKADDCRIQFRRFLKFAEGDYFTKAPKLRPKTPPKKLLRYDYHMYTNHFGHFPGEKIDSSIAGTLSIPLNSKKKMSFGLLFWTPFSAWTTLGPPWEKKTTFKVLKTLKMPSNVGLQIMHGVHIIHYMDIMNYIIYIIHYTFYMLYVRYHIQYILCIIYYILYYILYIKYYVASPTPGGRRTPGVAGFCWPYPSPSQS